MKNYTKGLFHLKFFSEILANKRLLASLGPCINITLFVDN